MEVKLLTVAEHERRVVELRGWRLFEEPDHDDHVPGCLEHPLNRGRPPRQGVPVDASVPLPFAVWEPRERCLGKHEELDALGPCTRDVLEVLV